MEKKVTSHIYKGCAIAIAYIVLNTIVTFAKIKNVQWTDFAAWFIIIAGSVLSIHLFSKQTNEDKVFGNLFSHGFKTTAVATCLIFIYVLLMIYIINPNMITERVADIISEAKKSHPIADDNAMKEFAANAEKITKLMMIAGTIMGTLLLGIIGSLIGAVAISKGNFQKK